jgi:hypothetical protein
MHWRQRRGGDHGRSDTRSLTRTSPFRSKWPGFWIIDEAEFSVHKPVSGLRCPRPGRPGTGSKSVPYRENQVKELISAVEAQRQERPG